MTVTILIDLFSDTEISVTSSHIDHPIKGAGFFFSTAKANLEQNLKNEVRVTIKKLLAVYRYSKFHFNPIKGRETVKSIEQLITRFNRKSSIEQIQSILDEEFDLFEGLIPSENARTHHSQLAKVNFLAEFVEFDFSSIQKPQERQFI